MNPAMMDVPVSRPVNSNAPTLAVAPASPVSVPAPGLSQAACVEQARRLAGHWELDPELTFLNHGSYGGTPRVTLQAQAALRGRVEREPVGFFKSDLEALLDGVREKLGAFVNARPRDLAPFCNATVAICTVLANTKLRSGDEVLVTDHEYSSGINELERICAASGARLVTAPIPFPIRGPEQVTDAVLSRVTAKTKLVMISHVTSATSLIFPVQRIVRVLRELGVDVLVDGAHGPGQVPVNIRGLDPTYYVGSLHKWSCGPKGTGFLYVHAEKQKGFRPVCLSSRANKIRPDRELYLRDFDYMGTDDYTGMLAAPSAIEFMGGLLPGGWTEVMARNHELIVRGREIVWRTLSAVFPEELPAPESMIGSMATLLLPDPAPELANRPTRYDDALQDALMDKHRIAAPIWRWGPQNKRVVRISAQLYNHAEQYERLAEALVGELLLERAGGLPH